MNRSELEIIARQLARNLSKSLNRKFIQIKKLLVNGKPVTKKEIAVSLNIPAEDVSGLLEKSADIEINNDGNIIGSGITLNPTTHHFRINSKNLYTWCAFDTLFFPVILNMTADVKSRCPVTGNNITLRVTPEKVESLIPDNAAISIVIPSASDACCSIRSSFCNKIHFFNSLKTAEGWLNDKDGIIVMTVYDGFTLGRIFTEYLLNDMMNNNILL